MIQRILPDQIIRSAEPQVLEIHGQHFTTGLKAAITDATGRPIGPMVGDIMATSFALTVRLAAAGTYALVVTNVAGAASNAATLVVK